VLSYQVHGSTWTTTAAEVLSTENKSNYCVLEKAHRPKSSLGLCGKLAHGSRSTREQ